jgi:hypothetical protein
MLVTKKCIGCADYIKFDYDLYIHVVVRYWNREVLVAWGYMKFSIQGF